MIKTIPNFPNYGVDEYGNIWSTQRGAPKIIKPSLMGPKKNEYLYVNICNEQGKHSKSVHRLVLMAWSGLPKTGEEACHNDGNKLNNSPNNLRWDTKLNNRKDMEKHGTYPKFFGRKGCDYRHSKLSEKQVRVIKHALSLNVPRVILGKMCGVTPQNISRIYMGKSWKHVII